jgi:lipoprotein-anchoring transpeptidase ErfK/SrfK
MDMRWADGATRVAVPTGPVCGVGHPSGPGWPDRAVPGIVGPMADLRGRRGTGVLLTLAAVLVAGACSTPSGSSTAWKPGSASKGPAQASPSAPAKPTGRPVHVRLYESDGGTYGVGMPIIAYLSAKITDGREFAKATKVTVDGSPVEGGWYFQRSGIYAGYPVEAHYRPKEYWPAHAKIHLDLPVEGLSAGTGLVFDNGLTLDMSTGPANVSRIDGRTEKMVVTSDGRPVFTFPVSLGKAETPTFGGIKVLMEKAKVERMVSTEPGNTYDLKVPWSVRITNSGEFIHSASWNGGNIGVRSTSHGCTNLNVTDAKKFFDFARIGDVTEYVNTGGPTMPSWDGYGDWNLDWDTWQQGGLAPTG